MVIGCQFGIFPRGSLEGSGGARGGGLAGGGARLLSPAKCAGSSAFKGIFSKGGFFMVGKPGGKKQAAWKGFSGVVGAMQG